MIFYRSRIIYVKHVPHIGHSDSVLMFWHLSLRRSELIFNLVDESKTDGTRTIGDSVSILDKGLSCHATLRDCEIVSVEMQMHRWYMLVSWMWIVSLSFSSMSMSYAKRLLCVMSCHVNSATSTSSDDNESEISEPPLIWIARTQSDKSVKKRWV